MHFMIIDTCEIINFISGGNIHKTLYFRSQTTVYILDNTTILGNPRKINLTIGLELIAHLFDAACYYLN